jgi:hypothetical protein
MPKQCTFTAHPWAAAIHEALAPYLHEIPYGNLRVDLSPWQADELLAIVYEVPGGSTNQITITHRKASQTFIYLSLDAQQEQATESLDEVLEMLAQAVARIPELRRQRLREEIDRWKAAGMSRPELFQQLNQLLHMHDLRGGSITEEELKGGIAYILA